MGNALRAASKSSRFVLSFSFEKGSAVEAFSVSPLMTGSSESLPSSL